MTSSVAARKSLNTSLLLASFRHGFRFGSTSYRHFYTASSCCVPKSMTSKSPEFQQECIKGKHNLNLSTLQGVSPSHFLQAQAKYATHQATNTPNTSAAVQGETTPENKQQNVSDTSTDSSQGSPLETVTLFHAKTGQLKNFRAADLIELSHKKERVEREAIWLKKERSFWECEWREVETLSGRELLQVYAKLAKLRLTGLVVITAAAGYVLAPGAFQLSTFGVYCLGAGLVSAAANTVNQFFEVPFDAQMNRTRNRPLVTGVVTPLHAMGFAAVTSVSGLTILYLGVSPLTAFLGLLNLCMYTLCYTPMKRISIANTWVGSLVGAIPPMSGWAASTGTLDPGAWLLGAILYSWQFPHFNSLSWNLRPDYSRAGYRMMSVVDPQLCKRVSLRHSIGLTGLCILAPVCDVTTWAFAVLSLPPNLYQSYLAYEFYKYGDSNSSRKLFRMTLIHLPLIMLMMIFCKKGFAPERPKAEKSETVVSSCDNT